MKAVGLKVLKNKLSEYVRLAERGETVLVADRDRVVAELVPPERTRSPVLADALLAEAVRQERLDHASGACSIGASAAQAGHGLTRATAGTRARPERALIYLDTSVALCSPRGGRPDATRTALARGSDFQPPA